MVRKWIKSTLCATVGAITLIFATPQQSHAQANLEIVFIDSLWGGGIGAVSGLALWAWKDQKSPEVTSMIARGAAVGVFLNIARSYSQLLQPCRSRLQRADLE